MVNFISSQSLPSVVPITHGSNPTFTRPAMLAGSVGWWQGTVTPSNAQAGDVYVNTSTGVMTVIVVGAPAGQVFADNFNRADSSTAGNGWTTTSGTAQFPIISNQMGLSTTTVVATHYAVAPLTPAGPNQYAQMDVTTLPTATDNHPALVLRYSNPASHTGYFGYYRPSTGQWVIISSITGTQTDVAVATATTPTAPYTLRFEAVGTSFTLKSGPVGGSLTTVVSGTSSANSQTGSCCIGLRYTAAGDYAQRVDNFSFGNIG